MPKTQSTLAKLSDTQLVILSAAAKRADHSLLPFSQSLTAKGAALTKVIETLCKRKLAEERCTVDGAPEWRRDEDSRAFGLFITTNGLLALGVEEADEDRPSQAATSTPRQRNKATARTQPKPRKDSSTSKRHTARAQTKQNLVIQMLRRRSGVTIDDIITKTDWQPHSVRGFLSGVVRKKLQLPLTSDVGKDGVRRYHIASVASCKASRSMTRPLATRPGQ